LSSIFLFETTGTEVGKIIDSLDLSKAFGYDQVSVKAMKACKRFETDDLNGAVVSNADC
jgi:hypothetical protein